MRNKKENILQRMGTNALLGVLEIIAEKNAASLCKGFMYEPEIPEKLSNVNRGDVMALAAKKDDASTSGDALRISGTVEP